MDYDYQQDVFKEAQSSIPIKESNLLFIIVFIKKKNMLY